jgi:hypothetical protein
MDGGARSLARGVSVRWGQGCVVHAWAWGASPGPAGRPGDAHAAQLGSARRVDANAARRPWHGRLARPEAWGHLAGGWKSAITRAWAHGRRCTVESTPVEWERRERQQRRCRQSAQTRKNFSE